MQDVSGSQWVDTASPLTSFLIYFGPWVLMFLVGIVIVWGVFGLVAYARKLLRALEQISAELARIRGVGGLESKP